jgi:hypothetical protein
MSKLVHALLQVAGVVIQYAALATSVIPTPYQPLVAAVVGLAQAGLAVANHNKGGASGQVSK